MPKSEHFDDNVSHCSREGRWVIGEANHRDNTRSWVWIRHKVHIHSTMLGLLSYLLFSLLKIRGNGRRDLLYTCSSDLLIIEIVAASSIFSTKVNGFLKFELMTFQINSSVGACQTLVASAVFQVAFQIVSGNFWVTFLKPSKYVLALGPLKAVYTLCAWSTMQLWLKCSPSLCLSLRASLVLALVLVIFAALLQLYSETGESTGWGFFAC